MSKAPVYHDPAREEHFAPVHGVVSLQEAPSSYSSWFILLDMNMRDCGRNRQQFMVYDVPSTLKQYLLVLSPHQPRPMLLVPFTPQHSAGHIQDLLTTFYNLRAQMLAEIVANARSTRDR